MANGPGQAGEAASQDRGESEGATALRFWHGEPAAFAQVVAANQEPLARLVYRLLGWSGDVEDVVQEVFLAAWRKRGQLRRPEKLGAWLAGIAVRRCRSYRRLRFLRTVLLGGREESDSPSPSPGAPQQAAGRETSRRVRQAVRELPARYREVAVLRYLQEMPLEEICRVLSLRPGAARVRLLRARRTLKDSLADLAEEGE